MLKSILLAVGLLVLQATVPASALGDYDWIHDRDTSWYTGQFTSDFPRDIPVVPTSYIREGTYIVDGYTGYEDQLYLQNPCMHKRWWHRYIHDLETRDPEESLLGRYRNYVRCAVKVRPLSKNYDRDWQRVSGEYYSGL